VTSIGKKKTLKVNVSGPTGSGKSTLVRLMATHPGVSAIPEHQPVDLLRRFDAEPYAHCFELQRTILSARLDKPVGDAAWVRLQDRSPEEDIAVFAAMFYSAGYLSPLQLTKLSELARSLSAISGDADAFVLLTAERRILEQRVRAAGAPNVVIDLLDEQIRLYHQWFDSLTGPRIVINTSSLGLEALASRGAWILSSITSACARQPARNAALDLVWIL
jgi:deoxyadenosine/deoxycytidine kinase